MSGLDALRAWVNSHQKQAMIGGAAGGVVIIALVEKNRRGATHRAGGPAGDPATATPGAGLQAGLAGDPNTLATDIGNQTQDQLNSFYNDWNAELGKLTTASAAATAAATSASTAATKAGAATTAASKAAAAAGAAAKRVPMPKPAPKPVQKKDTFRPGPVHPAPAPKR